MSFTELAVAALQRGRRASNKHTFFLCAQDRDGEGAARGKGRDWEHPAEAGRAVSGKDRLLPSLWAPVLPLAAETVNVSSGLLQKPRTFPAPGKLSMWKRSSRLLQSSFVPCVCCAQVLLTSQSQLQEVEVENSQLQLQLKELNQEYRSRLAQYIKDVAVGTPIPGGSPGLGSSLLPTSCRLFPLLTGP